jgi:hypothetical protein
MLGFFLRRVSNRQFELNKTKKFWKSSLPLLCFINWHTTRSVVACRSVAALQDIVGERERDKERKERGWERWRSRRERERCSLRQAGEVSVSAQLVILPALVMHRTSVRESVCVSVREWDYQPFRGRWEWWEEGEREVEAIHLLVHFFQQR